MQTVGLRPRLKGRRSLVDLMVGSRKVQEDDRHQSRADAAPWSLPSSPELQVAPAFESEFGDNTRGAVDLGEQPIAPDPAGGSCATGTPLKPCFEATEPQPTQHLTAHYALQLTPVSQHPDNAGSTDNSARATLPAQCGKTSSQRSLSTTSPVAFARQDQEAPTSVQATQTAPPPTSTSTSKQPTPQRLASPGDATTAPPSRDRLPESNLPRRASNSDRSSKMAPVRGCPNPPLIARLYRTTAL